MKILKTFATTLSFAVVLTACNSKLAPQDCVEPENQERTTIEVSVGSDITKATVADTENEAKVNTLQVFVFQSSSGLIDGYESASNTLTISKVDCTAGTRDIVCVANAPSLGSVGKKSDLLAALSLLSDNGTSKFVMVGKKEKENVTSNYSTTVNVDRIASRVKIDNIKRQFTAPGLVALESSDFQVTRIYVTNAVGNYAYGFSPAATTVWYSSILNSPASIATDNDLLYYKYSSPKSLGQGSSTGDSRSFYTYPNATSSDSSTARVTRLVVECRIASNYYTYPILIKEIGYNHSYQINELVITRLGNPSNGDDIVDPGEDEPIVPVQSSITVQVNDWEEVLVNETGTVTI